MKRIFLFVASIVLSFSTFAQVAYLQYRVVPQDKEDEFVEKETKYWSKVAQAAANQGHLAGWSLWKKVGVTKIEAPNYVFVNNYESLDKMDPSKVWSEANLKAMGKDPSEVSTSAFTTVPFDYWMQLEAFIPGEYKYALVNYAKPVSREGFIEENKNLWKPLHEKSIEEGNFGMTSWGLMSVIYPTGNQDRFSCLTWDGFNTMADVFNYMRYTSPGADGPTEDWREVMDKTKMDKILPNGFEHRIIYELVMSVDPQD